MRRNPGRRGGIIKRRPENDGGATCPHSGEEKTLTPGAERKSETRDK